jgi:GH43 family beta-xylosidase
MSSATTLGNAVKISTPTASWETIGANVNEGAGKPACAPWRTILTAVVAAIYHGGRTWLVFSASNCAGTGYSLGSLELTSSNPLSASSWKKSSGPIFSSANGNYQVGSSARDRICCTRLTNGFIAWTQRLFQQPIRQRNLERESIVLLPSQIRYSKQLV